MLCYFSFTSSTLSVFDHAYIYALPVRGLLCACVDNICADIHVHILTKYEDAVTEGNINIMAEFVSIHIAWNCTATGKVQPQLLPILP